MAENQAGLYQAPPFVALQCEDRVQRFTRTTGKPSAAPERHGLGARASGYGGEEGMAAFSDRAALFEASARDEQTGPRVTNAVWSEPFELLSQAEAQVGGRDDRVHPFHGPELVLS
jgi:hypothetical protein